MSINLYIDKGIEGYTKTQRNEIKKKNMWEKPYSLSKKNLLLMYLSTYIFDYYEFTALKIIAYKIY